MRKMMLAAHTVTTITKTHRWMSREQNRSKPFDRFEATEAVWIRVRDSGAEPMWRCRCCDATPARLNDQLKRRLASAFAPTKYCGLVYVVWGGRVWRPAGLCDFCSVTLWVCVRLVSVYNTEPEWTQRLRATTVAWCGAGRDRSFDFTTTLHIDTHVLHYLLNDTVRTTTRDCDARLYATHITFTRR